jgi:hypothetical protein
MQYSHFSERFDRDFRDTDLLDRHEAAQVLSANSGRVILAEYLSVLVQQDRLHPELHNRKRWYRYGELRGLVVGLTGGRHMEDNPSPAARRQRKYREKHSRPGGSSRSSQSSGELPGAARSLVAV